MPENILRAILETKRKEVAALREEAGLGAWRQRAAAADRPRNLFAALTRPPRRMLNLMAEVKRASPSAGVIRAELDAAALAREYEAAGADAISVLTDERYFRGCLDDLRAVREAVSLPVLRKEFIIDPVQVFESRAAGADGILLIASAVPVGRLADLMILAAELRMTSVVEVHAADELLEVRSMIGFPRAGYSVLGVNNRDLTTFEVDVNTTIRLAALAGDVPIISESGIKTRRDVERLRDAGVKAMLVGETLMRAPDVAAEIEQLLGAA
jgi:indole-3-glycerol phosphate synthase